MIVTGDPDWIEPNRLADEAIAAHDGPVDPAAQYVVNGAVVDRPALPLFDRTTIAAGGTDAAVLAVDRPFTATVDGTAQAVDTADPDGVYRLEFTALVAAEYRVAIDAWPYLPASFTVTAE
jgi:hypothetical protein